MTGARERVALAAAAVAGVGLAVTVAAAGTAATVVTYHNVRSPSGKINCNDLKDSSAIECSGPGIPEGRYTDTFVRLKPHGRAKVVEHGDFGGYSSRRHTLAYGTVWKKPGIRCTMRRTGITCTNLDGHGFHVQTGNFYRF